MSARAALQTLLTTNAALESAGVGEVYPTNSVDTPGEDLFIIVRWGPVNASFGDRGAGRLTLWIHDTDKDYGRINEVLRILKNLIPAQVHLVGEDGWVLTQATWLGESDDLYDEGYGTVTRYADFQTVSRYDGAV